MYMQKFNPQAAFFGVEPTDWGYREARKKVGTLLVFQDYAENLSFTDKSFDTVLLSEIIEHVLDPKFILDEAFRVAKKRVVITTPAKPHPDPDHKRVITINDMRGLLKDYCDEVEIKGLTFEGWGNPPKVANKEEDIHFQIVIANCRKVAE